MALQCDGVTGSCSDVLQLFCSAPGSPAAKVAEAAALLRYSSLHGQGDSDVRAFSADVRAAVRDSMDSIRSAALSNPSTRAPSLQDSLTVGTPPLCLQIFCPLLVVLAPALNNPSTRAPFLGDSRTVTGPPSLAILPPAFHCILLSHPHTSLVDSHMLRKPSLTALVPSTHSNPSTRLPSLEDSYPFLLSTLLPPQAPELGDGAEEHLLAHVLCFITVCPAVAWCSCPRLNARLWLGPLTLWVQGIFLPGLVCADAKIVRGLCRRGRWRH